MMVYNDVILFLFAFRNWLSKKKFINESESSSHREKRREKKRGERKCTHRHPIKICTCPWISFFLPFFFFLPEVQVILELLTSSSLPIYDNMYISLIQFIESICLFRKIFFSLSSICEWCQSLDVLIDSHAHRNLFHVFKSICSSLSSNSMTISFV